MKNNRLAIIPMRSGSKGIKDKNIKEFCGLPLFTWTLSKMGILMDKGKLDQCIISSDSDNYLDLVFSFFSKYVENEKFILLKRPEFLAGDNVTTEDVCLNILETLFLKKGMLSIIEVTSPNLPFYALEEMIDMLGIDTIESTFLIASDIAQRWAFSSEKSWFPLYEKREMRQNDNPIYKEVGAWGIKVESFLKNKNRIVQPYSPIIIGNQYGISINTIDDFIMAEHLFNKYKTEIFRDGF